MAADIDQLDAIIDKFMDYARPGETQVRAGACGQLIDREAALFRDPTQIRITSRVAGRPGRCWPTRPNWRACS
jgi:two-component system osmolarity sensor histidine kinase EnvZ